MGGDDLADWIEELRGKLDRGELRGLPPLRLDPVHVLDPLDGAARRLLDLVDGFRAMSPDERRATWNVEQRRFLAYQLRTLRGRLGGSIPEPDRAGPEQD